MKQTVPYDAYLKIVRESAAVATVVQSEGWKILEQDLLEQAGRIEELLAQNRLRTVQETITTAEGTKTFTTTAESQVAEQAGQYKQIQHLFDTIHTIIEAPEKLKKMEVEGAVTIQKATEGTTIADQTRPAMRLSKTMQTLVRRIQALMGKEVAQHENEDRELPERHPDEDRQGSEEATGQGGQTSDGTDLPPVGEGPSGDLTDQQDDTATDE